MRAHHLLAALRLCCLAFLLAVAGVPVRAAPAAPGTDILVLYAYGYGGRGVELFNEGFFNALTEAGFPVSNVHAEYLDLQRNLDVPNYRAQLRGMLERKYEHRRIGLIVTVQQPALGFLLNEGIAIAPGAPVITIQHRPLLEAEKAGRRIVGEVNQFDIRGTLEHALALFPQTRRVVFVSGSSVADLKIAESAAQATAAWSDRVEFEYTTGMALDAILARVAHLPPHSIVVFTQYNIDAQGHVALAYEIENRIVKAANAPVFGFYDYNLRNGGIGGSVIPVEASGQRAGKMALDILAGRSLAPGELKLNENVPMFDWRQIERWGGDASRLPAHAIFVHRPPPLWREYGGAIVAAVVVVLLQSLLIATLLANINRRQRAEARYAKSTERLRKLAETVEQIAGVRDLPGLMRIVRGALRELTGADGATLVLRENGHCHYVDEDAIGPLWKGQRFPLESCISGWAMLHEQAVVIEDIYTDARIPHAAYRSTFVHSLSMVPIGRKRPTGAIGCYWASRHRATAEELELQQALADAMAVGLANLDLYAEMTTARESAERAAAAVQANAEALHAAQSATLEAQRQGRLAALNLMEDAVAARARAEAANAALRESERRFREIFDSVSDAIFVHDAETGRILDVNRRMCEMYGYEHDAALGLDIETVSAGTPPYTQAEAGVLIGKLRQEGPQTFDWRARARDGRLFWVEVSLRQARIGGEPRVLAMVRDISERKATEEQLHKLSQAIEQSPESIVITNLDAEIEYVNDAFLRVTGYTREEVLGQNPRILHSKKTPPETHASLWETLERGESWKGEFLNRRKNGDEYAEFAIITPIRQADGRITHYVAVKEDITEKKRLAAELDSHRHHLEELVRQRTAELDEARRRADAANAAKSAFLANMSHEIRTPMNAIIGVTHLLRRAHPTPEQAARLTRIDTAAQHLLSIINDILDLSKIEAGKMELEQTDFALEAVLDRVRSLIAGQAADKGLTVTVEDDAVPRWLRGDPTRLRQALLNYAGNAVKFTERGHIVLRARMLDAADDALWVRFEVEDTGIGIAPAALPRLFETFQQADATTTRKYGGTGLGLTITQRLAQMMDGEVGVDSEPGRGSLFWFTARLQRGHGVVPSATQPAAAHNVEAELRLRHAGAYILLVEDNPVNREVALEILHAVGLAVDTAANGREAVTKALQQRYDLILMDVQMPELDGLAATREIRATAAGAQVPILAMTANVFDADRHACLAAGMNDFVAKPVDPDSLYTTLARWLSAAISREQVAPAADHAVLEEEAWRSKLAAIPGIDLERGLALMHGKAGKYARLLALFVDNHGDDAERIASLLAKGDSAGLRQLAHALKGTAGNLCATPVATAAADLLEAVHTAGDEEIGRQAARLVAALNTLVDGIRGLNGGAEKNPAPVDVERAAAVLSRLRELLATGDYQANELVQEERSLLEATLGATAAELLHRIELFDYDGALKALAPPDEAT